MNYPSEVGEWSGWSRHVLKTLEIHGAKLDKVSEDMSQLKITIENKVASLPCKERIGFYNSFAKQLAFMWGVIALLFTTVLGVTVKSVLEDSVSQRHIREVETDVNIIKEKSIGYQEYLASLHKDIYLKKSGLKE